MTERYVNINGRLAQEYTNGSKLDIPGPRFRAIYTKREYPSGGVVFNKIFPNGEVIMIGVYKDSAQAVLFPPERFEHHRTLVADGETIVMVYHDIYTKKHKKSNIENEFFQAFVKATGDTDFEDADEINHFVVANWVRAKKFNLSIEASL